MKNFLKILIGILVVAILAAGGWWIWKNLKCGPGRIGQNYFISYCNKSCEVNNDCKFTCGCGAINKNEICHDEGIIYDCVDQKVKCEKGKCVEGKEIISEGVTITTDKTEYEQGETVKTTITNNLDYSVTPSAANLVKADRSLGENYGIGLIEKFEDDKWVAIEPVWRCENSCFVECRYMSSFEPSETRVFEWEQTVRICNIIDRTEKVENAGPGKYRVSSNIWFIKEKNYKIIYSNEFTIK